jgi:hypothetical protein
MVCIDTSCCPLRVATGALCRIIACPDLITAQLVDGESGGHLWVDPFDRGSTDIVATQDEVARNIVERWQSS